MKIKKAVIPAAGLGTRLLPLTINTPKEMLPINNKPVLEYIIEEAYLSGIEEIYIIIRKDKQIIKEYFKNNYKGIKLYYIETENSLGSGYSINLVRNYINEPFAILYGDNLFKSNIPVLKQMINNYEKENKNIIGAINVDKNLVNNYGILKLKEDNTIESIIEKPSIEESPGTLAALGRYIVKESIFDYLNTLKPSKNGELELTTSLNEMMKKEEYIPFIINETYYDIGNIKGYEKALKEFVKD